MFKDLQFAIRSLIKQPGFTAAAVITLMLAIGVNTTIFSVVNAVLLRALPFQDPEHLVAVQKSIGSDGLPREADSAGSWNLAWAYMAGISYRLMGNMHIDAGYRHVNMGDVTTGRIGGNKLTFKEMSADEVRLGFRYVLD